MTKITTENRETELRKWQLIGSTAQISTTVAVPLQTNAKRKMNSETDGRPKKNRTSTWSSDSLDEDRDDKRSSIGDRSPEYPFVDDFIE